MQQCGDPGNETTNALSSTARGALMLICLRVAARTSSNYLNYITHVHVLMYYTQLGYMLSCKRSSSCKMLDACTHYDDC